MERSTARKNRQATSIRNGQRISSSPNALPKGIETSWAPAKVPRGVSDVAVKYHPACMQIRRLARLIWLCSSYSPNCVMVGDLGGWPKRAPKIFRLTLCFNVAGTKGSAFYPSAKQQDPRRITPVALQPFPCVGITFSVEFSTYPFVAFPLPL